MNIDVGKGDHDSGGGERHDAAIRAEARAQSSLSPIDWLAVALVALTVTGPVIFTNNAFTSDFAGHLWAASVEAHAISRNLLPTYFINAVNPLSLAKSSVFYPYFAFYGGTLYSLVGLLSIVIGGSVIAAFDIVTALAAACAYGGALWFARQLGARSWMAHVPALTFVTSAIYVTNLYARGAWPEVIATSMIPLLGAAGYRLATAQRVSLPATVLLIGAVVLLSGSQTITLAWGTVMIAVALITLRMAIGRRMAAVSVRRLGFVASLVLLGVGVNAWFLTVLAQHASDVHVSQTQTGWAFTSAFDALGIILYPLRAVPASSTTPFLYVQLPVWLLAWLLIVGVGVMRGAERPLKRALAVLLALLLLLAVTIHFEAAFNALPESLRHVQFPFRLDTYFAFVLAGALLVCVLALEARGEPNSSSRRTVTLGVAAAITCILCVWQIGNSTASWSSRSLALTGAHRAPSELSTDYANISGPVVHVTEGRRLFIDPRRVDGNGAQLIVNPPAGPAPFAINSLAGPWLVSLHGLHVMGRTAMGEIVAERESSAEVGSVHLRISLPSSGDIKDGRILSALSLLAIGALLAILGWQRRALVGVLRRRSAPVPPPDGSIGA